MNRYVPTFDKWFYQDHDEYPEYIVVDSHKVKYFAGAGATGYDYGYSILKYPIKGEPRVNSAVVLVDNTRAANGQLVTPIDFSEIPEEVRKIWLRKEKKIAKMWAETPIYKF